MKLSNGMKDMIVTQLHANFKSGMSLTTRSGFRIRVFDSSQLTTPYPLSSQIEYSSTYFTGNAPAGLLLDFGFTIGIPHNAFVISGNGRSIKLLGTYTENAKATGNADLVCILACDNWPSVHGYAMGQLSYANKILITDSVVANGSQGALVLTSTSMNVGDSVSIADFTINLIEP